MTSARVTSADGRPFPLQLDGDYIGAFDRVDYGIAARGLIAVS